MMLLDKLITSISPIRDVLSGWGYIYVKRMEKFKKPRKNGNCFYSYVNETVIGFLSRSFVMMIRSWLIRRKIKKSD